MFLLGGGTVGYFQQVLGTKTVERPEGVVGEADTDEVAQSGDETPVGGLAVECGFISFYNDLRALWDGSIKQDDSAMAVNFLEISQDDARISLWLSDGYGNQLRAEVSNRLYSVLHSSKT